MISTCGKKVHKCTSKRLEGFLSTTFLDLPSDKDGNIHSNKRIWSFLENIKRERSINRTKVSNVLLIRG